MTKVHINKRKLTRSIIILVVIIAIAVTASVFILKGGKKEYTQLSDDQIASVMSSNVSLDDDVQELVTAATSLVGKVHYFWGGKSGAKGWDDSWGELREVESDGSKTSGTMRPYGLDCSGYVAWCFVQLGYSLNEVDDIIGLGTYYQWEKSNEIEWGDLKPGDLVFQNAYPGAKDNHVGICVGYKDGEPVFAHCALGFDNVVVTTAGDVFHYARRPAIFC